VRVRTGVPSTGTDSPIDIQIKSAMLGDLLSLVGLCSRDPSQAKKEVETRLRSSLDQKGRAVGVRGHGGAGKMLGGLLDVGTAWSSGVGGSWRAGCVPDRETVRQKVSHHSHLSARCSCPSLSLFAAASAAGGGDAGALRLLLLLLRRV